MIVTRAWTSRKSEKKKVVIFKATHDPNVLWSWILNIMEEKGLLCLGYLGYAYIEKESKHWLLINKNSFWGWVAETQFLKFQIILELQVGLHSNWSIDIEWWGMISTGQQKKTFWRWGVWSLNF